MKTLLTGLLVCVAFGTARASDKETLFYSYQNEDGVTVIGSSMPPEAAKRGYKVIREDGSTVRKVDRELTEAEVVQRDAENKKRKEQEDADGARRRHDEDLVKLYASPRDVEEARDRKLLSIDTSIATMKSNLERLKLQKARFEGQAADREREGSAPSADILDNLAILETQIVGTEAEIAKRKDEKEGTRKQFDYDLERVKLLYGVQPAPDKQPPPAKPIRPQMPSPSGNLPPPMTAKSDALH